MGAYRGFGRRRSPEDISRRTPSTGPVGRAPADPTPGANWGKRLKRLGLIALMAFAYDEFTLARSRQAAADISPGLRIAAERYQTPQGCPGASWNEGQRMPAACRNGYAIYYEDSWGYGLSPPAGGWSGRQRWFRAGDDAVLAYCGLLVGCKATHVVRGRFYDAWERQR